MNKKTFINAKKGGDISKLRKIIKQVIQSNEIDKDFVLFKECVLKLTSSNSKNKFEHFFDYVDSLYDILNYKIEAKLSPGIYETIRGSVQADAFCSNNQNAKIFSDCFLFSKDVFIDATLQDSKYSVYTISTFLLEHVRKILEFKHDTEYYFIGNVDILIRDTLDGHRLKLIITPTNEISIIDPGSLSVKGNGVFFDILHSIYKTLEIAPIRVHNKDYYIVFPQLDSTSSIQEMLSVGDDPSIMKGRCTILANLIVHVMVYMRISSLKAVNLISITLIRKFLLNKSVQKFTDGYLLFLNSIPYANNVKPHLFVTNPEIFNNFKKFEDSLEFKLVNYTRDSMFNSATASSPRRTPLKKLHALSPINISPAEFSRSFEFNKMFFSLKSKVAKKYKDAGIDMSTSKTPVYYTERGLMPFKKTVFKITPSKSDKVFDFPKFDTDSKEELEEKIALLDQEINAINKNYTVKYIILSKIGEILFQKYKLEKIKDYFKDKYLPDFKTEPRIFIHYFGMTYFMSLQKYRRHIDSKLKGS